MGASKTDQYLTKELSLSKIAKGLGHPARWRMVNLIAENGPMCCHEFAGKLSLAQSTISQHLDILLKCRVVTGVYLHNETIYYLLIQHSLEQLQTCILQIQDLNAVASSPDSA